VLIDCDTCTVRGQGCDDCVVTVLLGAPPDWRGSDPTVVPLNRRGATDPTRPDRRVAGATAGRPSGAHDPGAHPLEASGDAPGGTGGDSDVGRIDIVTAEGRNVVELDEVERRAVRALADFGLVPPLRHQDASTSGDRHVS
jgi:hypothetical protein